MDLKVLALAANPCRFHYDAMVEFLRLFFTITDTLKTKEKVTLIIDVLHDSY